MIEKGKTYKLIYTSDIDFKNSVKTIRKIKENCPEVEIPFLYDSLDQESKDNFNSYLYIEESKFSNIFNKLIQSHMDVTFTDLGRIDGKEICKLITDCEHVIKDKVDTSKIYKVLSGEYKNIHVSIEKVKKDKVIGVFEVLDKERKIELNVSNIEEMDKVFHVNEDEKVKNYVQIAQEEDNRKAVIVDGNYVLHRSMLEYRYIYQKSKDIAIGGAFGFYFTLLSIKELFCEYEMYVVFGEKLFKNDEYMDIWDFNLHWVRRFIKALGFSIIDMNERTCEIISKTIKNIENVYKEIILYSNEVRLYNLITKNIKLYKSKETSRGYSILFDIKKACDFFEVESMDKINWAIALRGCSWDKSIVSINEYYDNKKNFIGKLRKHELISIINKSKSEKEFIGIAAKNEKYKEFIENRFVENLEILKINKIGNVKIQRNKFNIDQMMKLWEEIGFNREKEYVNKVNRIFRGVW
jgi:hypothetical protein